MPPALLVARWIHLVAAATWLGGLLVLGPLILTLRRSGVEREALRAAARTFARVTWAAMAVAIATGIAQALLLHLPWSWPRLQAKVGLVVTAVAVAAVHQRTAAATTPAVRGALEGVLLVATLGVYAAAVAL